MLIYRVGFRNFFIVRINPRVYIYFFKCADGRCKIKNIANGTGQTVIYVHMEN